MNGWIENLNDNLNEEVMMGVGGGGGEFEGGVVSLI
jgi:hypothetical protein